MFIKLTRSGPHRYVQLVEAYRDGVNGRPKQRTVATLGRLDQLNTEIKSVIAGLQRVTGQTPTAIVLPTAPPTLGEYKKGSVSAKRRGQCKLAEFLLSLAESPVSGLSIPDVLSQPLGHSHIESLSGAALKQNEDILDAMVCLYIAGLYAIGTSDQVFGDASDGYIYVPRLKCI